MTLEKKNDVKIFIDIPQPNGGIEKVSLEEMDSVEYITQIAKISKNVAISDTADLIFRMFAKAKKGDADIDVLSKKIACLGEKYLSGLKQFFSNLEMAKFLDEYNSENDKYKKREIRKQIIEPLSDYVSEHIQPKDFQFNFSKFKYDYVEDKLGTIKQGVERLKVIGLGLNHKDNFVMAAYRIWAENVEKRGEENRKAHWLLIKDSNGKIIGMTFISSKQLYDKRINGNIIGHSGQILDPSVQGRGYVSAIKSVMVDFMYDNIDENTATNSLFATTCDEFNENSQGLQVKSGAKPLCDKNGNIIIDGGKIHWYATKDEIMNCEMMQQCINRGIKYSVNYNGNRAKDGYVKILGNDKRILTNNGLVQGIDNDR